MQSTALCDELAIGQWLSARRPSFPNIDIRSLWMIWNVDGTVATTTSVAVNARRTGTLYYSAGSFQATSPVRKRLRLLHSLATLSEFHHQSNK